MKTKQLIILLFLVVVAGAATAQNSTARRLYDMKQYKAAKTQFIFGLKTNNSAIDWIYLGKIYSSQKNNDSAKTCYTNAGLVAPGTPLAMISAAYIEIINGDRAEAQIILEKAQKSASTLKDITALIEIAPVRYAAGDTLGWMSSLDKALEFNGRNPDVFIMAGRIYSMIGEQDQVSSYYGKASGRYEQALYFDSKNIFALNALSEIYINMQRYSDAEKFLMNVLASDSTYIVAMRNLGELYYSTGQYVNASQYYGKYIAGAEYSDREMLRYITILYFNKEYAKSNEYIKSMLLIDPLNPVLNRLNGYTLYETGKYSEGLDAMNNFFRIRETSGDTSKIIATDYEYLGKLYLKTGSDSLGVCNICKAISVDSTKSFLYEDVAKAYEKQKKFNLAVDAYEKFVAANNGKVTSSIYFSIGKDLLIMANECLDSSQKIIFLMKADSSFTKVIEISPNSHLGYLWHARALAALDPETKEGRAKSDYEKAITILEAKNDNVKYKNELIECYRYLGYYYYLLFETAKSEKNSEAVETNKAASKQYWDKLLVVDPANAIATQALKALNM